MERECPVCGESIELPDFTVQIDCPDCQTSLIVDADSEFIDGMWRDRTKLVEHWQNKENAKAREIADLRMATED